MDPRSVPGSDHLGHLLWETSTRWTAYAEAQLSEAQLSPAATGALAMIDVCPGITASELARESLKTQQAVSQLTGRLERLGYVERRVGQGRGVGLHITSSGKRALAEGLALEESLDRQVRTVLGDELFTELKDRLRAARAAITAAG